MVLLCLEQYTKQNDKNDIKILNKGLVEISCSLTFISKEKKLSIDH